MFKVIKHENEEQWNDIIRNSKNADIYYDWAYLNGFKLNGDGEPLLFTFINEETEIINAVIRRDISKEEKFKGLERNKYFDIISPYGYGGTLINTSNPKDIEKYFESLEKYCIKNNIVSEFVRFHPLINNYEMLSNHYEIIPLGETIAMDLVNENEIWSNLQTTLRSKVRQTLRSDVDVYFSNDISLLDEFKDIYESTMKKNNASEYYFFKDEYYESLFKDLNQQIMFCYAKYENEIIAISAILLGNKILHYHLSGTKKGFDHLAPNNVLLVYTALWGNKNGYKKFHLGGGVGSGNDSLLSYKKKFNKKSNLRFHIGKKIYDNDKYQELTNMRNFKEEKISFFPNYRFNL